MLDKRTDAFRVNTHVAVLNYDAIDVAFDKTDDYTSKDWNLLCNSFLSGEKRTVLQESQDVDPKRTGGLGHFEVIYVAKDEKDILTESRLKKIRNIEAHIQDMPGKRQLIILTIEATTNFARFTRKKN